MTQRNGSVILHLSVMLLSLGACTGNVALQQVASSLTTSASPTPTASTTSTASNVRAVKIIFKLTTSGGSFSASSFTSTGTAPAPKSGLAVDTRFNPDGSTLATGGPPASTSIVSTWPSWLTYFEIGISGAANTSATNPYCATFANANEISQSNCNIGSPAAAGYCGGPPGVFRVSEVDCAGTTSVGNGGPGDGIYMRAQFSRATTDLASTENILAVLEYSVAALNPAPSRPTDCFDPVQGTFKPETCTDFVWRAFLKTSATEIAQSYLILVPPTYSSVLTAGLSAPPNSGAGVTTRQFILPLSSNPNLNVLQISRTGQNFPSIDTLKSTCTIGGLFPGNSPLCAGMVIYSLTLYRI